MARENSEKGLFLVGLGIADEQSLPLAGLSALKECGKIFVETYTNLLPEGTIQRIGLLIGKEIEPLSREQVESEKYVLDSARLCPTALLVAGDPMIATTHISLLLAAKKEGIPIKVLHASSVISAAMGESGLQAYKFGKMATIAYWRENYKPLSAYDIVEENLSRNAHTLLLLDIDEKLGPMVPSTAAKILLEMESIRKKGIFRKDTKIILFSALGREGQKVHYCPLSCILSKDKDGPLPSMLAIPARLHFLEEEFLTSL